MHFGIFRARFTKPFAMISRHKYDTFCPGNLCCMYQTLLILHCYVLYFSYCLCISFQCLMFCLFIVSYAASRTIEWELIILNYSAPLPWSMFVYIIPSLCVCLHFPAKAQAHVVVSCHVLGSRVTPQFLSHSFGSPIV